MCIGWFLNLYMPTHQIKSGSFVLFRCCVHCHPGHQDKKPKDAFMFVYSTYRVDICTDCSISRSHYMLMT